MDDNVKLTADARLRLDAKEQHEVIRACEQMPRAIDAITRAFLADGNGHTLPEVAAMMGCPLALLRRVDRELTGGFAHVTYYRAWRDAVTEEWAKQPAPVRLWYPTREHLRKLLLASKDNDQ